MPQLVKGGKYVFGWSIVSPEGRIAIPPEAFEEYGFSGQTHVFLMSGSNASAGFALILPDVLKASRLFGLLEGNLRLAEFRVPEGQTVQCGTKHCCWVTLNDKHVVVPKESLRQYGITPKDCLLVIRGSGLGPGFIVRGRIVEEARQHPEINVFS